MIGWSVKAKLVFPGRNVLFLTSRNIKIGRSVTRKSTEGAYAFLTWGGDVEIANGGIYNCVSREHATLTWDKTIKKYIFRDSGSSRGSKINDIRASENNPIILNDKATIELGKVLRFQILY